MQMPRQRELMELAAVHFFLLSSSRGKKLSGTCFLRERRERFAPVPDGLVLNPTSAVYQLSDPG